MESCGRKFEVTRRRSAGLTLVDAESIASPIDEAGVTLAQVLLIARVERSRAVSTSDLARVSPRSVASTSQVVDHLIRESWLMRCEEPADRRPKTVSLTSAWAPLLHGLGQARTSEYASGLSRLPTFLRSELHGWLEQAF